MFKNYIYLFIGMLMTPMVAFSQLEGPMGRAAWERRITQDPQTGLVPLQELEKGREQVTQWYKNAKKSKNAVAIPDVNWKARGPNNIGGRTRAIMWDPQNGTFTPKRKKVWAGGVAGGLWTNNDISDAASSWIKMAPGQLWDNIAISSLAYDPTNKQILYAATGERGQQGSTGNLGSSGTGGGGIWKSIDGGINWNRLASTIPDYVTTEVTTGYRWREIYKVLVLSNGHVLALTMGGILKSINGGQDWTQLTGTGDVKVSDQFTVISDMELGTNGILYVAEGTPSSTPRILKSTNNAVTDFVLCPLPPGIAYGQGHVEIALTTQNNNQVIYAVSAARSTPDYRFFLKSVDGGANWTNMTPSTYKENANNEAGQPITQVPFFNGQGFWGLILGTHKDKPGVLYAGGVSFDMSFNGGDSWMDEVKNSLWPVMSNVMHADHHAFEANPDNNDEALFGNDGGVYYSNNWSATSTTLAGLNIQKRNKEYNVTQYFAVDLHPTTSTVVGGTQDNGTHAISSNYNTVGNGVSINGGDGAHTFIDQRDPKIIISSYTNISPRLHKNGAIENPHVEMQPQLSNRGHFINPADYDSFTHTYYANFTYDAKPAVTTSTTDTLVIRFKITTSTVAEDNGYTFTHSFLTYPVSATNQPIKVSFMKLGRTTDETSSRVFYIGTTDGDVYKTSPVAINGNQMVTLTKIMDKTTTNVGNVSSIDFGSDENTIIVTKSNYNVKSVFYATNADAGTSTTWISKDEITHGLPNIPIRYALINPKNTKEVLLATDLGIWSTTDITVANPDWKETNEALARVRCDMLKYRASDATLIVGTHGRGIFSTQLNSVSPPVAATPQVFCSGSTVANLTATGSAIQWYVANTGGTVLSTTTVLASGTYHASQTVGGVESTRTATSVTVNAITTPAVSISPTTICAGVTQAVTTTTTNGGTTPAYLWKRNNVDLATTKDITITNAMSGDIYALIMTPSADACANPTTATVSLTIGGAGCISLITSVVSGNWETPATWSLNRLPTTADNVIIEANHTVTVMTNDANAKKVETRSNGKVIFNNTTTRLKLGF